MPMQNKKTWVLVVVLIILDQAVKIFINHRFLHNRLPVLPPFIYFEPMFNRDYSWLNSMMQLGISKWVHIAIVAILVVLIYLFYQYLQQQLGRNKIIDLLFAFLFAGAMCSLIDKVFWDGSLDYILVSGFFTFDLKDVYINVFIGLLLLSVLLGHKDMRQVDDSLIKGFFKHMLKRQ